MELIKFEEFKLKCEKEICYRNTIISKNCLKLYKQENCYLKYLKSFEKNNSLRYSKDIDFRNKILKRDKTCRIWNILNNVERMYILNNYFNEYIELSKKLEVCHIISRSQAPELKYDETNVFLASKYFHSLLDTNKDLITQEFISKERRNEWLEKIIRKNNLKKEKKYYENSI